MLSEKLVSRIERNWERIAHAVIRQVRQDPNLVDHYGSLDEEEIRARAHDLTHNLKQWVHVGDEAALRREYEDLGRNRFENHVPLSELVYILYLVEWRTVEFLQDEDVPETALDLYTELETSRALHRFFGIVVHAVVTGYERASGIGRLEPVTTAVRSRR